MSRAVGCLVLMIAFLIFAAGIDSSERNGTAPLVEVKVLRRLSLAMLAQRLRQSQDDKLPCLDVFFTTSSG
jgi:hypothetical protein